MLREDIKTNTIAAMKGGQKERLATLRLINAKVKDRDIEARTGKAPSDDEVLITEVLQKMAKQRRESITMFDDGGRKELADKERGELAVIEEFLPTMMDGAATNAAIEAAKTEVGAESIKDMGKVMGLLKSRHGAELDMGLASGLVKASLS